MLDHLVYATPRLGETVADLAAAGLPTVPGGPHVGLGTRNHLAALGGGAYLEVIGPDPDQPAPTGPRPFGIDDLAGPALVAWCARPRRPLDEVCAAALAAGHDPGAIGEMSRRRPDGVLLAWRLTFPTAVPGVVPFLIDWLDSPHPSESLPVGPVLERFELRHPEPARVHEVLTAIGVAGVANLATGPVSLRAVVRTADGGTVSLGDPPPATTGR